MANKIQLKRGSGAPAVGVLDVGEPGFDTVNNKFYIGDSEKNPILINEEAEVYAANESVEESTEVINADTLGGHFASDFATTQDVNNLTAFDVGAAPAGYGLGSYAKWLDAQVDLNDVVENGWYEFEANSNPNAPTGFDTGTLLTVNRGEDGNYVHQIAFKDSMSLTLMQIRKRTAGTWGEWEWINPPMEQGVEYRTIERWHGKPVYVKEIDFITLPAANGELSVNVGVAAANLVSITGMAYNASNAAVRTMPWCDSTGSVRATMHVTSAGLLVVRSAGSNNSSYTATFTLKYIK